MAETASYPLHFSFPVSSLWWKLWTLDGNMIAWGRKKLYFLIFPAARYGMRLKWMICKQKVCVFFFFGFCFYSFSNTFFTDQLVCVLCLLSSSSLPLFNWLFPLTSSQGTWLVPLYHAVEGMSWSWWNLGLWYHEAPYHTWQTYLQAFF